MRHTRRAREHVLIFRKLAVGCCIQQFEERAEVIPGDVDVAADQLKNSVDCSWLESDL